MRSLVVNLHIAADEYQRLYQGAARDVLAYSADGQRVRFPAMILRPFVTHAGIRGRFRIDFDEQNRFQAIQRVD
jgi:hypothetical protein